MLENLERVLFNPCEMCICSLSFFLLFLQFHYLLSFFYYYIINFARNTERKNGHELERRRPQKKLISKPRDIIAKNVMRRVRANETYRLCPLDFELLLYIFECFASFTFMKADFWIRSEIVAACAWYTASLFYLYLNKVYCIQYLITSFWMK